MFTYVGNFVNDLRMSPQARVTRAVRLAWFWARLAGAESFMGSTSQSSSLYSSINVCTNGVSVLRRYCCVCVCVCMCVCVCVCGGGGGGGGGERERETNDWKNGACAVHLT